jgi:hypothetical protein
MNEQLNKVLLDIFSKRVVNKLSTLSAHKQRQYTESLQRVLFAIKMVLTPKIVTDGYKRIGNLNPNPNLKDS